MCQVDIVSDETDTAEINPEVGQVLLPRMVKHRPDSLRGPRKPKWFIDVEPMDDVMAQCSDLAAARWSPGIADIVFQRRQEFSVGQLGCVRLGRAIVEFVESESAPCKAEEEPRASRLPITTVESQEVIVERRGPSPSRRRRRLPCVRAL